MNAGRGSIRSALLLLGLSLGACEFSLPLHYFQLPTSLRTAPGYETRVLVRGVALGGIESLFVDSAGRMLVGNLLGASIYEIGRIEDLITWPYRHLPPEGMAADLVEGPDGTLVWTAPLQGVVYALPPGARQPQPIVEGLVGVHWLAFDDGGRLFVSRSFPAGELYEIDVAGQRLPRQLYRQLGEFGGFDFGPDGRIYGPLKAEGQIVSLDPDQQDLSVVIDDLDRPTAVLFDAEDRLWVADGRQLLSVQRSAETGIFDSPQPRLELAGAASGLTTDEQGNLYVGSAADNAILSYDPRSGDSYALVESPLAVVGDLVIGSWQGRDRLYVADVLALRQVELETGRVLTLSRLANRPDDWVRAAQDPPVALPGPLDPALVHYPLHLGVSADGRRLVLTSWVAGKVQIFDLSRGEPVAMRDSTTPHDATFLADGRVVWLEYRSGRLMISDPDLENPSVLASGLAGPSSLVVAGGDIYVSEALSGRIVGIEISSGAKRLLFEDLNRPEGMAMNSRGDLLVAEAGADSLVMLRSQSLDKQVLARNLEMEQDYRPEGVPETYIPVGVAVDSEDRIYVSSNRLATIYVLTRRFLAEGL